MCVAAKNLEQLGTSRTLPVGAALDQATRPAYKGNVTTPHSRTPGVRFVDVPYGCDLFDSVFALGESQSRSWEC